MGQPSGEIIARPMVPRACGCLREFQHYAVDKYRAQRLAKFQSTRCEDCVAKLNEAQRESVAGLPRGELFNRLPEGAAITLTRKPDGTWAGSLAAEGTTTEASGDMPQALVVALARQWLTARDPKPAATAPAPAAPKPAPAPPAAAPAPKPLVVPGGKLPPPKVPPRKPG